MNEMIKKTMKHNVAVLCMGLMLSTANAQYKLENISFSRNMALDSASGKYVIANALNQQKDEAFFTYKNLRLYMLKGNQKIRSASKDLGHYLSLQEAVSAHRIQITEMDGGSVNTLVFKSKRVSRNS